MRGGFGDRHRGEGKRGGWFMQPPVWGFLQPCLLLLLSEGQQHGYGLIEQLKERGLLGVEVDIGNLYRTLRRMEMAELVTSAWSDEAGPHKRVYNITPAGTQLLQQWAGALEKRTRLINRFLDEFHRVLGDEAAIFEPDDDDNPI